MPQNATLIQALVNANRSGTAVPIAVLVIPTSLGEAMRVQSAIVADLGEKVGGWKVGILADGTPMSAPMLAKDIRPSSSSWPLTPSGPVIVEAEIAVRLSRDLPPRPGQHWSRAEIIASISEVIPGIEIICPRLMEGTASPFPLWMADRLGNAGYVTGAAIRDFENLDLSNLRCRFTIGGQLNHDSLGGHPQNDPLAPILAAVNWEHHPGFKAGEIITTGSLIVPYICQLPQILEVEIENLGTVVVHITS